MVTFRQWAKGLREVASVGSTAVQIYFCTRTNKSKTLFHARLDGKFIKVKHNYRRKHQTTNQDFNFFVGSFSNRNKVRSSVHFRNEIFWQIKYWLLIRDRPTHFTLIARFYLMTRDLHFMILVEVFTNHILTENRYFTNHIGRTENKIMVL